MSQPEAQNGRIEVLDMVRALAIIVIILYHYMIEWYGRLNFSSTWFTPDGALANAGKLEVFKDGGALGVVKNGFVFMFDYGYTAVNLFLLLSGFVLTVGLVKKNIMPRGKEWCVFIWKRLKRILIPFYLTIILGVGFVFLHNVIFPQWAAMPAYNVWDFLKLFFIPFVVYDIPFLQKFNGDLWYVTLILQLYLLFPILYYLMKKIGAKWFLIGVTLLCVGFRTVCWMYLSSAPMGVIADVQNGYRLFGFFLPRLFEFGFGMVLAVWYCQKDTVLDGLRTWKVGLIGAILATGGIALNTYNWGWSISDPVISVGLFALFMYLGFQLSKVGVVRKVLKFISDSSYELFLLHHYYLNYLLLPMMLMLGWVNEIGFWLNLPLYVVVAVLIGEAGRRLSALAVKLTKS